MFENRENSSLTCSSPEDLAAYIYDELDEVRQPAFEDHLAGCDACSAELAELSLARLGVYEWHRDEFVGLETPRIIVPYETAAATSWFHAVLAWFPSPSRVAPIGAAFAALTIIAAGFWLMQKGGGEVVRNNEAVPDVLAASSAPSVAKTPLPELPSQERIGTEREVTSGKPEAVKAVETKPAKLPPRRQEKARAVQATERPARPVSAPRLNDFDDDDDNTLRLGDLLAEVDTRDE